MFCLKYNQKLSNKIFDNSKIIKINRWGKDAPTEEGKIMQATFELNGNLFMCSDSPPVHEWNFTPAVSNYIECENENELERLFSKLSENGKVMMPLRLALVGALQGPDVFDIIYLIGKVETIKRIQALISKD